MRKIKVLYCLATLGAILCSCSKGGSSSEPFDDDPENIVDVKTCLLYMKSAYNFQLKTMNTTSNSTYYEAFYTSSYYLSQYNTDYSYLNGYIQFSNGVSRLEIPYGQDEVCSSEIVFDDKALYKDDYSINLSSLNIDEIDSGESITLKKKSAINAILPLIGISSNYYISLKNYELSLSYLEDTLTISFALSSNGTSYEYETTISYFGESSVEEVEAFVQSGGEAYQLENEISQIRELFYKDNYTREELNSEGEYNIREYFTTQYYFDDISESYLTSNVEFYQYFCGYLKIQKDNLKIGSYSTLNYDDVYLIYALDRENVSLVTRENPSRSGYAQGAFTTIESDLSYVMNYPSNLLVWSDFQRFRQDGDVYYTEDYEIIDDFISNFGITVAEGMTVYVVDLEFSYKLDGENTTATFVLNCVNQDNQEVVYTMNFGSFGTTAYEPIENFLDTYGIRI